jgi:hypothetical protein
MAMTATDPETGARMVNVNGEWRSLETRGNLAPFGFDTGIELPDVVNSALISAGGKFERLGEGVQEILGQNDNALQDRITAQFNERQELMRGNEEAFPVSSAIGNVLPELATAPLGGQFLRAGQTGTKLAALLQQGGIAGGIGALDFDPEQSPLSRFGEGTLFGFGGQIIGDSPGRVLRGIKNAGRGVKGIDPAAQKVLEAGGQVTPGQLLNNETLRGAELSTSRNFLSSKFFDDITKGNQELINAKAARAIGLSEKNLVDGRLTEEAVGEARDALGDVFSDVTKNVKTMNLGENFGRLTSNRRNIKPLIDFGDFKDLNKGIVKGSEYQTLRQTLSEEAADAKTSLESKRIFGLIDDLDKEAAKSMGKTNQVRFKNAREQWRNLIEIQKADVNLSGNISAPRLKTKLDKNFGTVFKTNKTGGLLPETQELFKTTKALADTRVRPRATSQTGETNISSGILNTLTDAVVEKDPGKLKGIIAQVGAGKTYAWLATNAPEFLESLLTSSPEIFGTAGARIGAGSD